MSQRETVRCLRITEPGGPEVLRLGTCAVRAPGPGELGIEVVAAGVNRADTLQRRGFYPAPPGAPADVPGLEYAGRVTAVGSEVRGWAVGDPVMGITGGGAMSERLVVHHREALPVPRGMDLVQAAAIPEVFLTAWDALVLQGGMGLGSQVLVHAIASGVGTAALQLARACGATLTGTGRSPEKLERCRALGLRQVLQVPRRVRGEAWAGFATAFEETGWSAPDLILDPVGASYLAENLKLLAPQGRMVLLGLMGGVKGEIPLGLVLRKRLSLVGTVLRARPLEEKATLAQRFRREVVPLFESGALTPVIDGVLPMNEAAEAHRRMEANTTFGKLVLQW